MSTLNGVRLIDLLSASLTLITASWTWPGVKISSFRALPFDARASGSAASNAATPFSGSEKHVPAELPVQLCSHWPVASFHV